LPVPVFLNKGKLPEDHDLVLSFGFDPEEDPEALLLHGHGQHCELGIVDVRQDVSPK